MLVAPARSSACTNTGVAYMYNVQLQAVSWCDLPTTRRRRDFPSVKMSSHWVTTINPQSKVASQLFFINWMPCPKRRWADGSLSISLCLVSTLVRTQATCFHSFICPPFSLILYLLSSRDKETKRGPGLQEVVLCKRLIGEVVQSWRSPLLGPFLVESGY